VLATDRGLCGGYNTSIVREVKALVKRTHRAKEATAPAKTHQIQMAVIGRKAKNTLKRECADGRIAASFCKSTDAATDAILQQGHVHDVSNTLIKAVVDEVVAGVESGKIGSVLVVTGRLNSIISQPIEVRQLVPLAADFQNSAEGRANGEQISIGQPPYTIFEPKLELLITQLLAYHLKVRLNTLHLENTACEHAARMSAMDNATRNARDMIQNLQLRYNQGRQAQITNELIEIISGSNAV
jgi:F-type H+-transporting ATPase subunit gamma